MRRIARWVVLLAACSNPPIAPAAPTSWQLTGNRQTGIPGYRLADLVTVRVVGADGSPIVGDTIDLSVSDPFAAVEPAEITVTDSTGTVSTYWRLGPTIGTQTLTARSRIPGVAAATVNATATSNSLLSIDGGSSGLCGIDQQGRLGCWLPPRLRLLDPPSRFVPVSTPASFSSVALIHAVGVVPQGCVLATSGRVWCFNLDSQANISGLAELTGTYPALTQLVSGGSSAGTGYCGLTSPGEAWCWGANGNGQLGDGTTVDRTSPVASATSARFSQLNIGGRTTCGITVAGEGWCWGDNRVLQAGVAVAGNVVSPAVLPTNVRFSKIRPLAYAQTTCGISLGSGLVCWGDVTDGLLACASGCAPATATPVAVATAPQAVDLAEENGFTVVFDQQAALRWTGFLSPALDVTYPFLTSSAIPSAILRDIRLGHGAGFICGDASLGGATLCPSSDGLIGTQPLRTTLVWPAVIGVPLP